MRQPKFKGFSIETNSWHYGHGWFEVDYTDEYLKEKGIEQQAILYTEGYPIECELKSMSEYTGLNDVNGKEIFEGDILVTEDNVISKIVYDEASFKCVFYHHENLVNCILDSLFINMLKPKIIGNIYDNPDLFVA